jgi:hypothetical protein
MDTPVENIIAPGVKPRNEIVEVKRNIDQRPGDVPEWYPFFNQQPV